MTDVTQELRIVFLSRPARSHPQAHSNREASPLGPPPQDDEANPGGSCLAFESIALSVGGLLADSTRSSRQTRPTLRSKLPRILAHSKTALRSPISVESRE